MAPKNFESKLAHYDPENMCYLRSYLNYLASVDTPHAGVAVALFDQLIRLDGGLRGDAWLAAAFELEKHLTKYNLWSLNDKVLQDKYRYQAKVLEVNDYLYDILHLDLSIADIVKIDNIETVCNLILHLKELQTKYERNIVSNLPSSYVDELQNRIDMTKNNLFGALKYVLNLS